MLYVFSSTYLDHESLCNPYVEGNTLTSSLFPSSECTRSRLKGPKCLGPGHLKDYFLTYRSGSSPQTLLYVPHQQSLGNLRQDFSNGGTSASGIPFL